MSSELPNFPMVGDDPRFISIVLNDLERRMLEILFPPTNPDLRPSNFYEDFTLFLVKEKRQQLFKIISEEDLPLGWERKKLLKELEEVMQKEYRIPKRLRDFE